MSDTVTIERGMLEADLDDLDNSIKELGFVVCRMRGMLGGKHPWDKDWQSVTEEEVKEGMADLHGTTTADDLCLFTADQIEAAGFVRKEDMDKAINALRSELMPEIRRAQYPKVTYTTTQDDGDAD